MKESFAIEIGSKEKWAGLVSNVGAFFGPVGASEVQENVGCYSEGELTGRQGVREVTFDN